MRTINIHAAKTQLSRLVDAAAAGEEIIIGKAGKPYARLCPLAEAPRRERVLGILNGKLLTSRMICEPWPDEFIASFEEC